MNENAGVPLRESEIGRQVSILETNIVNLTDTIKQLNDRLSNVTRQETPMVDESVKTESLNVPLAEVLNKSNLKLSALNESLQRLKNRAEC